MLKNFHQLRWDHEISKKCKSYTEDSRYVGVNRKGFQEPCARGSSSGSFFLGHDHDNDSNGSACGWKVNSLMRRAATKIALFLRTSGPSSPNPNRTYTCSLILQQLGLTNVMLALFCIVIFLSHWLFTQTCLA